MNEVFQPTEPSAAQNATEAPNSISLESIAARLPPEGQAWRSSTICVFVEYWKSLRDTLEKLERDFGPSDNWT